MLSTDEQFNADMIRLLLGNWTPTTRELLFSREGLDFSDDEYDDGQFFHMEDGAIDYVKVVCPGVPCQGIKGRIYFMAFWNEGPVDNFTGGQRTIKIQWEQQTW